MTWLPIADYLSLIPDGDVGPHVFWSWPDASRPGVWRFGYGHGAWWDHHHEPTFWSGEWIAKPTHFSIPEAPSS